MSKVKGLLPYASNTTLLAELATGEAVVYKPGDGERPLWDFAYGTLGVREVLTYETALAMGRTDLVPETWLANGPLGQGSAQRLLDEDFDFDAASLVSPRMHPWTWPVALLDIVTNNADRKLGHMIRSRSDGSLWAIDHGLTFHEDDKLRTVLWGHAACPFPEEQRDELRALSEALGSWLGDRVAELLDNAAANAFEQRVQRLTANPVHPEPPRERPAIPWPVY